MGRVATALGVALCLWGWATSARAFQVASGVTDGCHERITVEAYVRANLPLDELSMQQVPEGAWEGVAQVLFAEAGFESELVQERFFVFSLLVGVRAPDLEGYSQLNLSAQRAVHGNPNSQYKHCLRAPQDDGEEGDRLALGGCRQEIEAELVRAAQAGSGAVGVPINARFTLDGYGAFQVDVWSRPYQLGRALHALQDGFSHTLRTADMQGVVHVMNFIDAVGGGLEESRDGMAHSAAADSCLLESSDVSEPANRERVLAAVDASAELLRADYGVLFSQGAGDEQLSAVMDKWLAYVPGDELGFEEGCASHNNYCENTGLEVARMSPTRPLLSCALGRPQRDGAAGAGGWLLLVCSLGCWLRRRGG